MSLGGLRPDLNHTNYFFVGVLLYINILKFINFTSTNSSKVIPVTQCNVKLFITLLEDVVVTCWTGLSV